MKIGILTFHWGTNYGGVLQAYALQEFLKLNGNETSIINFAPKTFRESFYKCFITRTPQNIINNINEYIKDKNIEKFRKKYLTLTDRFVNVDELKYKPPLMDVYITGSDQVWNPYSLNQIGLVYFLNFGSDSIKRISYAVSLGCTNYPTEALMKIKPLISKFNALSVREKSGVEILKNIGFNEVKLMPDPTLLLNKEHYLKRFNLHFNTICNQIFFYKLQKNQSLINIVEKHLRKHKKFKIKDSNVFRNYHEGVENWIENIYNSKYVITNSFHGVVFSIIFNKQFIAIPIEGKLSGMNDRLITLLEHFQLRDRILNSFNEDDIEFKLNKSINWEIIEDKQNELKRIAFDFLNSNI